MGRRLRPYLPGVPFHITARIAFRQHLLEPDGVQAAVCGFIADALPQSDANLLAFCIMTNHFHVIVVQGVAPLSRLMRPIMVRTALRVHRTHGVEGRVFERPFFAKPCADPYYLREMIAYTHL